MSKHVINGTGRGKLTSPEMLRRLEVFMATQQFLHPSSEQWLRDAIREEMAKREIRAKTR